jgi:hypothetical protein
MAKEEFVDVEKKSVKTFEVEKEPTLLNAREFACVMRFSEEKREYLSLLFPKELLTVAQWKEKTVGI